jgi:hypothetical protein
MQGMAAIGYFFLAALVDPVVLGTGILKGSATGADNFLACLGFFASRLLRI